ncbi:LacI family transcriptional regulator [Labedella phragmitis]|uniref:LacI family transcriptional regulator n=2 Tax=Labedella phragmitis TaxID=2498849 RepID=A0A3S4BKA4_9MICO|nr:LacI family transcriptional regulator [Labedella phragmitis]
MAEIARAAGTSVPTVSKVLNGGTDVSEGTRRTVMEAAHGLGYKRHPRRHRAEEAGESRMVDVIVGHLEGSWISRVLEGVERETAAADLDLVLTVADPAGDWVRRLLRRSTIGAIVVLVEATAAQLHTLAAAGVQVVVVDPGTRPPREIASIGATNWEGGRLAAEHLLAGGHTDVAVIGGSRPHLYSSARIDGFSTAFRDAGHPVPPERVIHCGWDRGAAREAATALLGAGTTRPSAVFACSDLMALGVYDAAARLDLRIPEELSVVGFDDVREAAWAAPALTTIQQPITEMGAAAFRMLRRLGGRRGEAAEPSAPRIELETRLVVRGSTAQLRRRPVE